MHGTTVANWFLVAVAATICDRMKGESKMRYRQTSIVIIAAFTLAASMVAPGIIGATQSKGGKAGTQMSDKGRVNTNAQWTADPAKGWVRAEERHLLRDQKKENSKENGGNRKGKGQKKKD